MVPPTVRDTDYRVDADDRRQRRGINRASSRSNSGDGTVVEMNTNDVEWLMESRDESSVKTTQEDPPSRPAASKRPSQLRRNKVQPTPSTQLTLTMQAIKQHIN